MGWLEKEKVSMNYPKLAVIGAVCAQLVFAVGLAAAETNQTSAPEQKIGVYDSRVVAYAHFWTKDNQLKLDEARKRATAAKAAGDTAQFNELDQAFQDGQTKMHREVFSSAPPEEALAAVKDRIPEIQKQAGVSALISKWDERGLSLYKSATQVDVTDRLVREFHPTEKQWKTIAGIKQLKPVPLEQIGRH
jgi:hypothetical protein